MSSKKRQNPAKPPRRLIQGCGDMDAIYNHFMDARQRWWAILDQTNSLAEAIASEPEKHWNSEQQILSFACNRVTFELTVLGINPAATCLLRHISLHWNTIFWDWRDIGLE